MGTHWSLDGLIPENPPTGFFRRHQGDTDPVDENFWVDGAAGSPVADDLGRAAWNITGDFSRYIANPQYPQIAEMKTEGWRAAMEVHNLLTNDDATDWGVHLEVSDDTDTYLILIGSDALGNPTLYHLVAVDDYTMQEISLSGISGNGYHRYEMVFDPDRPGMADVLVDGIFQATFDGADNTIDPAWSSRMVFGSTESGAVSNANYSFVELAIGGQGLIPGDADGNGIVNEADAAALAANWLKTGGARWKDGDFNDDGNVDDVDAAILASNWQNTTNSFFSTPEPATFMLLATLLVAACLLAPRKRNP